MNVMIYINDTNGEIYKCSQYWLKGKEPKTLEENGCWNCQHKGKPLCPLDNIEARFCGRVE